MDSPDFSPPMFNVPRKLARKFSLTKKVTTTTYQVNGLELTRRLSNIRNSVVRNCIEDIQRNVKEKVAARFNLAALDGVSMSSSMDESSTADEPEVEREADVDHEPIENVSNYMPKFELDTERLPDMVDEQDDDDNNKSLTEFDVVEEVETPKANDNRRRSSRRASRTPQSEVSRLALTQCN